DRRTSPTARPARVVDTAGMRAGVCGRPAQHRAQETCMSTAPHPASPSISHDAPLEEALQRANAGSAQAGLYAYAQQLTEAQQVPDARQDNPAWQAQRALGR